VETETKIGRALGNVRSSQSGWLTRFKSPPGTTRGFCQTCGSTLTCESVKLPNETHFHVGTFDDADRFEPSKHFFRDEQLPWLHLTWVSVTKPWLAGLGHTGHIARPFRPGTLVIMCGRYTHKLTWAEAASVPLSSRPIRRE